MFLKKNKWQLTRTELNEYNSFRNVGEKMLCYAPFHSLTFLPTGDVAVCCFNQEKFVGHYPDNNIDEIWNGKVIDEFRRDIRKRILCNGCEECYAQIKNKNYYSALAWHYDFLRTKKNTPELKSIEMQLSNKCNFECIMCSGELSDSIRRNREKADNYDNCYDNAFVKQLIPYITNLENIACSGGEAFLNPLYYKIWDIVIQYNPKCRISVSTNGSLLNETIKHYLSVLKYNFAISIDAVDSDIYKSIRIGGDLNKVLENFLYYKDYCNKAGTSMIVKICPIRQNVFHIPEVVEYFCKNNTYIQFNTVYFPPSCSLWNLSHKELEKIIRHLKNFQKTPSNKIEGTNYNRYDNLINQLTKWKNAAEKREELNLSAMTDSKLLDNLYRSISSYFKEIDNSSAKKEAQDIIEKINISFNAVGDEKAKRAALEYFYAIPTTYLIPQIKNRSTEMLIQRLQIFKQL